MSKTSQKFEQVGKVKSAHGLKGEVFVLIFSGDASWSDQIQEAQLTSPSSPDDNQILKIESLRPHKEGLIIKFESIQDRNQSEALRGFAFSIPEEALISKPGETIYLREVLNFEVYLKDQFVGFVKSFSSNGVQDLLVIQQDDHSYEVPFVSDFILNIDFTAHKLYMDFPEGLMNVDDIE